ncbi:hypothetical protein PsorP6_014995 [Peronosclerospora sorghi]|uniref:Uncharacterized protein n=1 Tax=Peronosclerospora sorghi TaxID=230839 RepID=A0ACC0VSK5_9STRA|nr:hypothetical protein PsorP6_014995 [Peronosclerospora sorghi]
MWWPRHYGSIIADFVNCKLLLRICESVEGFAFPDDLADHMHWFLADVSTFYKKTFAVEDAAVPKQGSGSGSCAINSLATFQNLVIPQKIQQWTEGNSTTWSAAWIERLLLGDKHYSDINIDDAALKLMGGDEPPEMLHINGHDVQHFSSTALWNVIAVPLDTSSYPSSPDGASNSGDDGDDFDEAIGNDIDDDFDGEAGSDVDNEAGDRPNAERDGPPLLIELGQTFDDFDELTSTFRLLPSARGLTSSARGYAGTNQLKIRKI